MAAIALGLLSVAPSLVQGVIGVVHSVERIFGAGKGADKKQAAVAMSSDLLNIYSTVAPALGLTGAGSSEMQTALSNLIDSVVAFYNASGVSKSETGNSLASAQRPVRRELRQHGTLWPGDWRGLATPALTGDFFSRR